MATVISLDDHEILWLEEIVMDRDKDEALKFAQKVKKKIDQSKDAQCKPPF